MSPQDYPNPFSPERQRKILRFADDEEDPYGKSSAASISATMAQQMQHAFAMHALNQGHGVGLRNEFSKDFRRLKIKPPRPRTFILGHKAGLWLTDYSYQSFCDLAKALALHEQQTIGYVDERNKRDERVYDFYVEIEGERQGKSAINPNSKKDTFRETFETAVLPLLNRPDPKPRIRVRAQIDTLRKQIGTHCNFDCDCDDSRELELMALDVGRLRVLAEWHRWNEDALLHSNSLIFETTMFDLLYPSPAFADEYEFIMELPDHTTYRLVRGTKPMLGAEAQQALSRFTTIEKEAGVQPRQVQLWPRGESTVEMAQASPCQKSPGKVLQPRRCKRYVDRRTKDWREPKVSCLYTGLQDSRASDTMLHTRWNDSLRWRGHSYTLTLQANCVSGLVPMTPFRRKQSCWCQSKARARTRHLIATKSRLRNGGKERS